MQAQQRRREKLQQRRSQLERRGQLEQQAAPSESQQLDGILAKVWAKGMPLSPAIDCHPYGFPV